MSDNQLVCEIVKMYFRNINGDGIQTINFFEQGYTIQIQKRDIEYLISVEYETFTSSFSSINIETVLSLLLFTLNLIE